MAELVKESRFKIAVVWIILATVLFTAVIYHKQFASSLWYYGIIATEFALYITLALALLKPSWHISLMALFASAVWLVNQICNMGWFDIPMDMGTNISLFSAILNTFLLAAVAFFYLRPQITGVMGMSEGLQLLLFAFFVVVIYGVMKFSVDMALLPQWGTGALSGALWAFGILLMAVGTLVSLVLPAKISSIDVPFMLTVVGLIIAMYAAMAYGMALIIHV